VALELHEVEVWVAASQLPSVVQLLQLRKRNMPGTIAKTGARAVFKLASASIISATTIADFHLINRT